MQTYLFAIGMFAIILSNHEKNLAHSIDYFDTLGALPAYDADRRSYIRHTSTRPRGTPAPVDILIEPGGSLYVSDDHAGAIYRVVGTAEN